MIELLLFATFVGPGKFAKIGEVKGLVNINGNKDIPWIDLLHFEMDW